MSPALATSSPGAVAPRSTWVFAALLAAVTATVTVQTATNVPFWDDFIVILRYLLRMEDAAGIMDRLAVSAEYSNEHSIVTTHLLVWSWYSLLGGFDFRLFTIAMSALLLPLVALLTLPLRDPADRTAAVFFSSVFLLNFQHYENLFWGLSAAGHVAVVVFAVAALWCVQRPGTPALVAGLVCALLAMTTVIQGIVVWPVAIGALWLAGRRRDAVIWALVAAVVIVAWYVGYAQARSPTELPGISFASLGQLARFWLGLLGAPLAFGQRWLAPWMGGLVLAGVVLLWRGGALRRHAYHASVLGFAAGALGLIALGRVGLHPTQYLTSRYRVLSCLILATLGWMVLRESARRGLPRALVIALALGGAALALEQSLAHARRGALQRAHHLAAATHYAAHGTLGGAPFELFPNIPEADALLARSRARGIHDLAAVGRATATAGEADRRSRPAPGQKK